MVLGAVLALAKTGGHAGGRRGGFLRRFLRFAGRVPRKWDGALWDGLGRSRGGDGLKKGFKRFQLAQRGHLIWVVERDLGHFGHGLLLRFAVGVARARLVPVATPARRGGRGVTGGHGRAVRVAVGLCRVQPKGLRT